MTDNRLLIVDDDASFRLALQSEMKHRGYEVSLAPNGSAALAWLADNPCDLMVLDLRLPDMSGLTVLENVRDKHPRIEVVLLTGHGTIDTAIEAIRAGAFHYLTKPTSPDELEVTLQKARERRSLVDKNRILQDGLIPPDMGETFVGASPQFAELVDLIERVAKTDSTVLIQGETGVGKELVAKLVHNRSERRDQPFVVVDCGNLQENLLQSELFGHEKGAYTGADRLKHGLFEAADRGTIFLDEIGDISPGLQVKLLRVLETGSFRRLGGTAEQQVDVRVLAATNRDLNDLVERRIFREDLLYRLNTIRIDVPPLRDRPDDACRLALYYIERFNEKFGRNKQFSPEAMAQIAGHNWPGNVRQLIHVVERAVVLSDGPIIEPKDLPAPLRPAPAKPKRSFKADMISLAEVERQYIEFVVEQMNGHRAKAAEALGISERSLYRKLHQYGLID